MQNPFGTTISSDDIIDTLSFFDDWEDRYHYIIDLGKQLPEIPEEARVAENLIAGCQSQVWITSSWQGDKLQLVADSDAFIVKGLVALVLSAYNNKTAQEVADFDVEGYFSELNLLQHLSPTRGNGLRAMVQRIKQIALST